MRKIKKIFIIKIISPVIFVIFLCLNLAYSSSLSYKLRLPLLGSTFIRAQSEDEDGVDEEAEAKFRKTFILLERHKEEIFRIVEQKRGHAQLPLEEIVVVRFKIGGIYIKDWDMIVSRYLDMVINFPEGRLKIDIGHWRYSSIREDYLQEPDKTSSEVREVKLSAEFIEGRPDAWGSVLEEALDFLYVEKLSKDEREKIIKRLIDEISSHGELLIKIVAEDGDDNFTRLHINKSLEFGFHISAKTREVQEMSYSVGSKGPLDAITLVNIHLHPYLEGMSGGFRSSSGDVNGRLITNELIGLLGLRNEHAAPSEVVLLMVDKSLILGSVVVESTISRTLERYFSLTKNETEYIILSQIGIEEALELERSGSIFDGNMQREVNSEV